MKQNPDLILREIYGKSILMPIRYNEASNDPIYFNEVAALIWKLSDGAKDPEDLSDAVCESYNLGTDSAEAAAVEGFINQLKFVAMEQNIDDLYKVRDFGNKLGLPMVT